MYTRPHYTHCTRDNRVDSVSVSKYTRRRVAFDRTRFGFRRINYTHFKKPESTEIYRCGHMLCLYKTISRTTIVLSLERGEEEEQTVAAQSCKPILAYVRVRTEFPSVYGTRK